MHDNCMMVSLEYYLSFLFDEYRSFEKYDDMVIKHNSIYLHSLTIYSTFFSVNCFIYGFTNPHFLQGYRKFLCLDVCFGDQPYLVGFGTTSDSDKGGPTSNMKSGVNNKVFPSSVTTKTSILPPVNT